MPRQLNWDFITGHCFLLASDPKEPICPLTLSFVKEPLLLCEGLVGIAHWNREFISFSKGMDLDWDCREF